MCVNFLPKRSINTINEYATSFSKTSNALDNNEIHLALQEQCSTLTEQLLIKENLEKSLKFQIKSLEDNHAVELGKYKIELERVNSLLLTEQSERKLLALEKKDLEGSLSNLNSSMEKSVNDALEEYIFEFRSKEVELEEEIGKYKTDLIVTKEELSR